MWCAYVFAGIALISLPAAIQGGVATPLGNPCRDSPDSLFDRYLTVLIYIQLNL
jgi:hypothetical protein